MLYILSLRLTFWISLVTGLASKATAQVDFVAPALHAEQSRFEAMVAADTAALRKLLHPDLLYIHSNGLEESAEDLVSSVAAGKIVYASFEPQQPPRLYVFGRTALVDGLVRVRGKYQGEAFAVDLRYTSVYRKVEGSWLLIRWQSLKV